ncbi:MAG: restriction endonuclease subunit S [Deltaproteobacteria bacterium]|nr:restriction endonuclease subunit S [Deltaproteobacteria bacterium]
MTNWKFVRLEEIATVERGKFSARPRNDPKYYGGNIPFLQTGDVASATGVIESYSQTLNDEGLKVSRLFPAGTLLITIAANIGDIAEVGFDFACPDSLVAIRPQKGTSKDWLKYFLQTQKYYFKSRATQNAQANINLHTIKPLSVNLPPFNEQTAIASLLSTWDKAIEKTERLIGAKESRFKWWLNKLFIDGSVSDEWKSVKLGDVATILKKLPLSSVEGKTLLTVKLHCLGIEANTRIKPKLTERGRPYYTREAGEFLIGRQNFHNGGFGIVPAHLDGYIASNAITSLSLKSYKLISDFLFYYFCRRDYYKRVGQIMDGTGQKELSDKQILKLKLNLPNLNIQKTIADTLNTAQQEINLLKKQLNAYKTQKRGLMQKVLTGRWRVKGAQTCTDSTDRAGT